MDKDLKHARISVIVHTVLSIIVGWVSVILGTFWYAFPVGIIILVITGFGLERIVGKRGLGWWFGNGMIIYLFLWYVSWVLFFNGFA